MKMIHALIQPGKLRAVQNALSQAGIERVTACDATGYGRQRGQTELYRGIEYKTNLIRKVALEIAVNDDFVERAIDVIINVGRSGAEGSIGDGKIFVLPIEDVIQIGGVARGREAV